MRAQLARGGFAASPGFALGIGAGLIELGRIYSLEPYARSCDVDRVAVDHPRASDDDRVRLGMPVAIELIGDEARRDRNRDPQVDVAASPRPAGGAPVPPRYGRAPQDLLAPACAVHLGMLFYLRFSPLASFVAKCETGCITSVAKPKISAARRSSADAPTQGAASLLERDSAARPQYRSPLPQVSVSMDWPSACDHRGTHRTELPDRADLRRERA